MAQDTEKSKPEISEVSDLELFSIKEVTDRLKIGRTTLYHLTKERGIQPVRIGKRAVRYTSTQVTKLITP